MGNTTGSKRNLLVLMSDEHQARAMGCDGHPFVKTPNLDALAARGTRFTNAYTPCPICVPARASFATGQYVHQTRLWDNAMPYTGKTPGWGHALQAKSVPVESIGKLHYRADEDPTGFDTQHIPMMVAGGVGMVWAAIRGAEERVYPDYRMFGDYIGPGESNYTKYDDAVVERTVNWLKARASDEPGAPWCLYVGLVAPHFPLVVPQEFFDMYPADMLPEPKLGAHTDYEKHPWVELQNALLDPEASFKDEQERQDAMSAYFGLCTFLDTNIGTILKVLEEAGFADNTNIVYTSDHGDHVGSRGLWGKSTMYEESVKIPMIMAGPDVPVGTCETPVSLLDLSETIVDHFDGDLATDRPGRSLYELSGQATDPDRVVLSEYHAIGAVDGAFMVRKGDWKYVYYVGFEPELFDLRQDPEELTNLVGVEAYKDQQKQMHQELLKICDPEKVNARAHDDQRKLVDRHGGFELASKIGAPGATPPPSSI